MYVSLLKNICLIVAFYFVALSFVQCATIQQNGVAASPRIVGGYIATENYPYMASIKYATANELEHICGGSIINERTVLTAAHCLAGTSPSQLKIHVGDNTLEVYNGTLFNVQDIQYHSQWNSYDYDYDVGLIRIADTFNFGPTVQPIKLVGAKERIRVGSYATIMGWGHTQQNGPNLSEELRVAVVPIVRQTVCNRQLNGFITKRMICAGYARGGVDSCKMDSGGPLIANNKQIGIVSWGEGCAQPNKPGVYGRITALLPWIENTLHNEYNDIL